MVRVLTKVGVSTINTDYTYATDGYDAFERWGTGGEGAWFRGQSNRNLFPQSDHFSYIVAPLTWTGVTDSALALSDRRFWQCYARSQGNSFAPLGRIQWRNSQEIDPLTAGEITPIWNTSAVYDLTFTIPNQVAVNTNVWGPTGLVIGKQSSTYMVGIGTVTVPGYGSTETVAGFRIPENTGNAPTACYAFPWPVNAWDIGTPPAPKGFTSVGVNWNVSADPDDSSKVYTLYAEWTDGAHTAYKRMLAHWTPAGTYAGMNYNLEEIQFDDATDQSYFVSMASSVAPENAGTSNPLNNVRYSTTEDGIFVSINIVVAGVTTRKFYQIDPTFTEYREIILLQDGLPFFGENTTTGVFVSNTDDGHVIAGYNGFSGAMYVFPDAPPVPNPLPTSGDVRVRAWTFSLDGHDFYVLKLGTTETLVYDAGAKQWHPWASLDNPVWALNTGTAWQGGTGKAATNIVVGDLASGALFFLDPMQPYDDAPGGVDTEYFERVASAFIPARGRTPIDCFNVYLSADFEGDPTKEVTLETSDDAGQNYDDHGAITVQEALDSGSEYAWRSLGQITAPGRIFRVSDNGAAQRLDGLEINDGNDDDD